MVVCKSCGKSFNGRQLEMYEVEISMVEDVVVASRNYPYIKEAWQTLKDIVLAQRTNNKQSMPLQT